MSPAASTRWCPTPEQLMILEEMYRGGIRTPNASQIQQITAHLSFYGKIEGKNVFYWFQNHKARDRQKLRRKLCRQQQQRLQLQLQLQQQNHHHHHLLHHCDSSGSAALQQLSSYNSSLFPPQGGLEDQAAQAVNYAWNVDISSGRNDSDISMTMMYGRDWLMKTDVGATTFCCNKPLKTLELFPITTTGLKDESTTPKHFSTSSSSTN